MNNFQDTRQYIEFQNMELQAIINPPTKPLPWLLSFRSSQQVILVTICAATFTVSLD